MRMAMAMATAMTGGGRRMVSKLWRAVGAPLSAFSSSPSPGQPRPRPSLQCVELNAAVVTSVGFGFGWRPITPRWMSCCAGLGAPPPREVIVEYGEEEDNTDHFIQLADAIEEAYPELVVLGNPEDMESRKGSFEVTLGGQLLFSKLKEKRLPKVKEILVAIDAVPPACQYEVGKPS